LGITLTTSDATVILAYLVIFAIAILAACIRWAMFTFFGLGVAVSCRFTIAVLAAFWYILGNTRAFQTVTDFICAAIAILTADLGSGPLTSTGLFICVAKNTRRAVIVIFAYQARGRSTFSYTTGIKCAPCIKRTLVAICAPLSWLANAFVARLVSWAIIVIMATHYARAIATDPP
jgi:hypothetical protein